MFCPTPPLSPAPSYSPSCVPTVVPGTVTRGAVEAGCSLLSLGLISSQRPGHACQGGQRQPSPVESQALGPGEAQLQGLGPVKDKEVTRVKRMTRVCNLFSRLSCLERRSSLVASARESTVSGGGESSPQRWAVSQSVSSGPARCPAAGVRGALLSTELITCRTALKECCPA